MNFDIEDELVILVPGLFGQQCPARREILKRCGIRCRNFSAPARNEIQLCDPVTFLSGHNEVRAAVELINNLEDPLLLFLSRGVSCQQSAYSEMGFGPQFFWD